MREKEYKREEVIKYAEKWAYSRNPKYYNFENLGGDCTNFVSQCIYAGANIMNYNKINGWYYNSVNGRSPSWTGIEFLYQFLINNKGIGPYADEVEKREIQIGDIIQLAFVESNFAHSLIIVGKENEQIYTASHTYDSFYRNTNSYNYNKIRYLHIKGVRIW